MIDPNVFATEWEPGAPPGLRGARVGAAAGATELGVTVYELEAGARDLAVPRAARTEPRRLADALVAAMELDAAEDQRGLSTS